MIRSRRLETACRHQYRRGSNDKYRAVAVLTLLFLTSSALVLLVTVPSPTRAASAPTNYLLHDDFTQDTSLNQSLWQVNGPVGSVLGLDDAGISLITLEPSFSSAGMEIAQINASEEVGTIQSIENFTPPFTATATVEGTVSNGHTFGFAISSTNASYGVLIYGNLNPTNCSHLGDCGDPTVCGTPANSAIPQNQCYYGIDGKTGRGGGSWEGKTKLYLTPSVNVTYTLQISVDASGNAQYSVSQGGQVLGTATAQVRTGPFYIILEQGEGAPVAHPGPNQAYWMSVSLTPSTTPIITPSPSGISVDIWILVAAIIIVLFLIILLWYRRSKFIVTVRDIQTLSPIPGATVTASGPKNLSGPTEDDGKVVFSSPKKGDYSIQAGARGYITSVPVTVSVKGKTEYTVKLDRVVGGGLPSEGPKGGGAIGPRVESGPGPQASNIAPESSRQTQQATTPAAQAVQQGPVSVTPREAEPAFPQPAPQELPELQGWGGDRIRQIIKTFQAKGAISPETAMTAKELGLSRMFVRIMERRKGQTRIFVEINGKYYLDQKALQEMR